MRATNGVYRVFNFAKYAHRDFAEVQYQIDRRFNLRSIWVADVDHSPGTNQYPMLRLSLTSNFTKGD